MIMTIHYKESYIDMVSLLTYFYFHLSFKRSILQLFIASLKLFLCFGTIKKKKRLVKTHHCETTAFYEITQGAANPLVAR